MMRINAYIRWEARKKIFFSFFDNDDDVRQQSIHPSVESHVYDLDLAFEL